MKIDKTYVLGMFPYPSGEGLHVGHVRIFTACDVMARYFKMKGQDVLSPMGWDAIGLPAENAAIKAHKMPQEMVPHNYANFKKQMQNLSLSFDWDREFATCDPEYYAITQWIFLQLYGKKDDQGRRLIYREKTPINWCPKCKTGLANEEVMADGTHERCGTVVGKKLLPQWVMKITEYAERLLNDLDGNDGRATSRPYKSPKLDWPKGILEMQRNWIGKKEGINITYQIDGSDKTVTCFTTRPDTNYGATFIVIAPEHKLAQESGDPRVKQYCEKAIAKSEIERQTEGKKKTGVFTGMYAVNQLTGRKMPIWVSDFVLAQFGTGAVVGVPGHDKRDFEFAHTFDIPIIRVVVGQDGDKSEIVNIEQVQEENGTMINSDFLNGMEIHAATAKIMNYIEEKGWGKRVTTYHLRDWVFSRQRYWGEPIPLVYCEKCGDENGVVPVPEDQLPLELPKLESYEPTDTGESPLSRVTEWVNTKCPQCGGDAKRETDTMPNWAGSCWYFLAFAFWGQVELPTMPSRLHLVGRSSDLRGVTLESQEKPYTDWWMKTALPKIKEWLPVDWYLGGAEHAVLHLLYARFWVKVLQDLGLLDFSEPFLRLRSVGLVLAEDGKKMSKSIGNVVNPDDMVAKYGSDAVRMYEMFMGPWEQSIAWDSGAISGQVRFLGRVMETVKNSHKVVKNGQTSPVMAAKLKILVARVEDGVLNQKFNTSIAGLMEFVNSWREPEMVLSKEHVEMFASLLSLFAPKLAKEIARARQASPLQWPDVSQIQGVDEVNVTIAVQVNGKLRGTIQMLELESRNQELVVARAMEDERVKKWLQGEVKKTIFVPGKLVNLVI